MPNETPKTSPETPVEDVKFKTPEKFNELTPEQQADILKAQKSVAKVNTTQRLEMLQNELKPETKEAMKNKGINATSLLEEDKGIIDTVTDTAQTAVNYVKDVVSNPVGALNNAKPNAWQNMEKMWENVSNGFSRIFSLDFWKEFASKLFDGKMKEAFSMFGTAFGFGEVISTLKDNGLALMKHYIPNMSGVAESAIQNVLSTAGFGDLTLETLRKNINTSNLHSVLNINESHNNIKMFLDNFFDNETFTKMSTVYTNKAGAQLDESKVTVADFFKMIG